jgi:hypothetical protein
LVVTCFFYEKLSYLNLPNVIPSTDFLTYTFGDESSFLFKTATVDDGVVFGGYPHHCR